MRLNFRIADFNSSLIRSFAAREQKNGKNHRNKGNETLKHYIPRVNGNSWMFT